MDLRRIYRYSVSLASLPVNQKVPKLLIEVLYRQNGLEKSLNHHFLPPKIPIGDLSLLLYKNHFNGNLNKFGASAT